MKYLIVLLISFTTLAALAQDMPGNNNFSIKEHYNRYNTSADADNTALKLLTGLMFYEKQNDRSKLSSGFFIGGELEFPFSSSISFFKGYFVPEMNYWSVENKSNLGVGINFRAKFKAGSLRPYLDLGFTYNMFSNSGAQRSLGGINTGIGIDIAMAYSNLSIVFDLMARIHIINSKGKGGISLTPGIRIAF